MRWLALALMIVNIGFVVWQLAGAPGGPQRVVEPPPEIGYLALLREPADAPAAHADAECFSLGPFADADTARAAGERLSELGLNPERRVIVDEETIGYQIILPPFDSRSEAQEATHELASAGIDDYYIVMDEGELRNAVSLGLFSERNYAIQHRRYLHSLGFEPEMRLRTRERERFWLEYRDAGHLVRAEEIEAWVGQGPLQRLPRDC